MSDYETILVEVNAIGVGWLTFNRPEKRNALDLAMVEDIRAALGELERDPRLKVLVFSGAGGKAFISGADIAQLLERTHADALRRINSDLFREIEAFPAPTIAMISGYALGGGCELAMACDLRVAGEGAKLGQPEVGLGIIPAAGATYRLPRLVGLGRARELVFTGRLVGAVEAERIGLVNRVVPDEELRDATCSLAKEIASQGNLAVRMAKQVLNCSWVSSLDTLQALESAAQGILFDDDEKKRRMMAFLDKRAQRRAAKAGAAVLEVRGAVGGPREFTRDDLLALPSAAQVEDVSTLAPGRAGRAVLLQAVIDACQPEPGAEIAKVFAAEGFSAEQPLSALTNALILFQFAGQALEKDKGGPFRLLIPGGSDRCANVKQVTSIELA
ncbi:MAG: enoyl-CoA hydratase/isomerase family protein [Planctomycetes bacterium]|nr:enoyl-CoA hydratase/isomerase family protein [Planctomycetota bacterium]